MCSPCRASVMTGLMPSQHGIRNWLDDTLASHWPKNWSAITEFNTLPKMFKQQGYKTALIGKFHLGIAYVPQLAFDHWVTFPHGHTTSFYGNDVIDQEQRYRFEGHTVDFFIDKAVDFIEVFLPRTEPYGLTVNAECSLPSFTAFATIHTDLTVQDHHSIISQVSHAKLLTKLYGSQHRQVYQSVF